MSGLPRIRNFNYVNWSTESPALLIYGLIPEWSFQVKSVEVTGLAFFVCPLLLVA